MEYDNLSLWARIILAFIAMAIIGFIFWAQLYDIAVMKGILR